MKTKPSRLFDVLIGVLLAVGVSGAAFEFAFPRLHPSVWSDYAGGVGLRPLAAAFPALWTLLARNLAEALGPMRAVDVLPMVGRGLLGIVAALVYVATLRQIGYMSPLSKRPLRQWAILRVSAFMAAVAFVTSDPVWTAAQTFSPGFLTFFLFFVSLYSFQSFYFYGGRIAALICAITLMLGFVETPVMLVPGLVLGILVKRRWIQNFDGDAFRKWVSDSRWAAFGLSVLAAIFVIRAGVVFNYDDWVAAGEPPDAQRMIEASVVCWVGGVLRTARLDGWLLLLVLSIGPLIGLAAVFRKACDEESSFSFLGLICHIVYVVFGFFQFVAFGRFGVVGLLPNRMCPGEMARLPTLLVFAFCLALAMNVLVTEAFTRRVVWHHDKVSNAILAVVQSASNRFRIHWRRCATVSFALFVLSLLAMPMVDSRRSALVALHDFLSAVIDDATGCSDICTDGRLDDGYRLEAARRGVALRLRPMLTRGSKLQGLMQRVGLTNEELKLAAEQGPAVCLRAMVKDHPRMLETVAVQMGFEVWRMELRPLPPMWGTLARFSGTPEEQARSVEAARALSLRFTEPSSAFVRADAPLEEAFDAARWRLSRMAKCRAEAADRVSDEKTSASERARMKALDAVNIRGNCKTLLS